MTKFSFCGVPDTGSAVSVSISASAFSDDGARVANGTGGRIVRVCETATGRDIASIAVPSSRDQRDDDIDFVAFSPDGARLVTASSDRMMRLWDTRLGRSCTCDARRT